MKITVSVVGPRNLSYLPLDLIPKIGADRAENASVELNHGGGGGIVLKQLLSRNSDFAAVGFTAIMSLKMNSKTPIVAIAPVADLPLFILVVRSALRDQIKTIADLKGRIIGVHTSSVNAKTAAQQLVELLLHANGLETDDARIIPSGQSWAERVALLEKGEIDALMAEEPFASSMLKSGRVYFLASLADEKTTQSIPGAHFLHTSLTTRPEIIAHEPEKVDRMVKILRRSLTWIASHTPEELVTQMQINDPQEKELLKLCLQKYPRLFSKDAQFSQHQLAETQKFFLTTNPNAPPISVESLLDARWVGMKGLR
ncbi:MAG: ABC transporter substrate-binding protein [Magnetococcales bacterium]|nr:ABC transporter substrate-binding protein [Magnetococcales bacterium]